jgi:acyl homoserine lactone synthase
MIECVTLETNHLFFGNPIAGQHKLRYESIIKRQNWNVPNVREMEFDQYDNPAAYYFVDRNAHGEVIGTARLYPTIFPYMLEEVFPHLVKGDMPKDAQVWEGSRIAIDKSLSSNERTKTMHRLVLAYLEFAVANNIKSIIGVMFPVYWKNIFIKSGWNVEWLGEVHRSEEKHKIVAGDLKVTRHVLSHVRKTVGITEPVLNYGSPVATSEKVAAYG